MEIRLYLDQLNTFLANSQVEFTFFGGRKINFTIGNLKLVFETDEIAKQILNKAEKIIANKNLNKIDEINPLLDKLLIYYTTKPVNANLLTKIFFFARNFFNDIPNRLTRACEELGTYKINSKPNENLENMQPRNDAGEPATISITTEEPKNLSKFSHEESTETTAHLEFQSKQQISGDVRNDEDSSAQEPQQSLEEPVNQINYNTNTSNPDENRKNLPETSNDESTGQPTAHPEAHESGEVSKAQNLEPSQEKTSELNADKSKVVFKVVKEKLPGASYENANQGTVRRKSQYSHVTPAQSEASKKTKKNRQERLRKQQEESHKFSLKKFGRNAKYDKQLDIAIQKSNLKK